MNRFLFPRVVDAPAKEKFLDELEPVALDQAAGARWLCDLDLRERFVSLPDYVQRLQQMRLGLVPMDATILP